MSTLGLAKAPGWSRLALLAILVFDVWLRGHTIGPTVRDRLGWAPWPVVVGEAEPLDCDEAVYAYMARRMLRGDVLYRDLSEPKPPGGYWLYALAVALGGAGETTIRLVPIPLVLATIVLIWWLGLRLRGPAAACLAALIFAVASTDPYLYGNGANLEHAINLFSVAALALLVFSWGRAGRLPIVATGACLGAACLVKQVAIAHVPVFAAALLMRRTFTSPKGAVARPPLARVLDLLALLVGFGAVLCLAAVVLAAQGAGRAAFEDVIVYGATMAAETPPEPHAPPGWVRLFTGNSDPSGRLPWPFGKTDYLVWWGSGTWPLWFASIPALAWLAFGPTSAAGRRLVAAWTLSAWVQVALPGLFWAHYYLLPMPGLALAVAVFLADAIVFTASAWRRIALSRGVLGAACSLAVVASLIQTARMQVRDYLMVPSEALTRRYKGGGQWIVHRAIGRDLARRAEVWADPRLAIWGWQSPLYVYSGLDNVTRHFFGDPLMKAYIMGDFPGGNPRVEGLIRPRLERIMDDFRARPPELIFAGDPPFPALRAFLSERYLPSRLVMSAPDGRGLWVERGKYAEFESRSTQDLRTR